MRLALLLALTACSPSVLVSGTVRADEDGTASGRVIEGATITVDGPSSAVLTTGADGRFEVSVPAGTTPRLHVEAPGFVGLLEAVRTSAVDVDHVYGIQPEANVDYLFGALGLTRDPALGILVVDFATPSTAGGEGATIDLAHEETTTRDEGGNFTLGDRTAPGGEDTFVGFLNVTPGLAQVVPLAPEGWACRNDVPIAAWPVHPNTITTVRVTCEAR
jgi:hypothetical protein